METPQLIEIREETIPREKPAAFDEKNFFPSGAIAFFIALVALGLIIWFGIYFLMLERI